MPTVEQRKMNVDVVAKRKAIKLVVSHLKKKLDSFKNVNRDPLDMWISKVETLLAKDGFVIGDFIEVRKDFNDIIERTYDVDLKFKLRDSWIGFGKALEKKAKLH